MYRRERRRFVRWLLERLRREGVEPAALRFLDAGCGTGELLEDLANAGCTRLTGLDMTDAMLAEAQRHVAEGTRLVSGTIEEDPFGEERFDVVLSVFTVHHLHDPGAFFRLADRLLAPGGHFFILDYNGGSPSHRRAFKRAVSRVAAPLRAVIKLKNRHRIAELPDAPRMFNPSHHELSWTEMLDAMPRADAYELHRRTRGYFMPAFNYAFTSEAGVDGALMRTIDAVDGLAKTVGGGYFQWIEGARRAPR
jgi:SAM-dependent methyltransferase